MMSEKNLKRISRARYFCIAVLFLTQICGCGKSPYKVSSLGGIKVDKLRPRALEIVERGLMEPDPRIRTKAVETVAATSQKQLMPRVRKLLWDDYVPVRFAAALAVGDARYYPAGDDIKKLLNAPDENTKLSAAYAMYKLGHKQHLEIIKKAVSSPDQKLRGNAVMLLGKCGDDSVLELLYWAKNDDSSERAVRYQATEAIAALGDEKILPKIWTLLISKFVDNKLIGVRAMGALGTPQAQDALLTKLDDDVLEVRLAAARQLGILGDNTGQQQVIQVFRENVTAGLDEQGRERVLVLTAFAVGSIGTDELVKYLPDLLEDKSIPVRLAAARAVLKMRAKDN